MKEYHDQVSAFGHCLLDIISKGLGLENIYDFTKFMNYCLPYHKPELVKARAMSILLQDDGGIGSLQRWSLVCGRFRSFSPNNIAKRMQSIRAPSTESEHTQRSRDSWWFSLVVGPLPEMEDCLHGIVINRKKYALMLSPNFPTSVTLAKGPPLEQDYSPA
ncbi:hypothetical protein SELMODRAFT_426950 [Selaginella moellendorffii]|uniref:Uncharacterized protein n=1 Tax=Selaginella moellendorffii TaxID=88036 RepID=D8SY08_SELML|nr:hypothetical protein SELMODRAFT_426950 [Selaginella moellendorffii]